MINRNSVVPRLVKMFLDNYKNVMKHYINAERIEITEHLLEVLELLRNYQKTKDDNLYKEWQKKEDVLLKKYRDKLRPYKAKFFHSYFEFETVILTKELYTAEEYNSLPEEEQGLSERETKNYLNQIGNGLRAELDSYYMEPTNAGEKKVAEKELLGDLPDKDVTRSRQLLTIYYMLKAGFNIEHRKNSNVSDVAKLIHLMTGTKFTTLNSSEIYKKYKDIPTHKKGAQLIKDLKFIRPYFESLDIKEGVRLIDEDINRALQDVPLAERKKYR